MTDKKAQRDFLTKAQAALDLSAPEMAIALETPFNTYRAWLYGRNPMPGVVAVAVNSLLALKPFAHDDLSKTLGGNTEGDDSIVFQRDRATLRIGDFKWAKKMLEGA